MGAVLPVEGVSAGAGDLVAWFPGDLGVFSRGAGAPGTGRNGRRANGAHNTLHPGISGLCLFSLWVYRGAHVNPLARGSTGICKVPPMPARRGFNVRMDDDVLADLGVIARRQGLDVSDLLRRGARMVIAAELPVDDEERTSPESAEDIALRRREG